MKKLYKLGIVAWFLCSCFFMYEFFLRVFSGSISVSLINEFHLDPNRFSFLGSSYYLAYAIMQIPAGFLIARFGARKIGLFSILLCLTGVFVFVFSYNYPEIIVARILMGLGSSFAFVNLLVVSKTYFPPRVFGLLAGSTQIIGNVGPILAGLPFVFLVHFLDNSWRHASVVVGIFGIVLFIFTYLFLDRKSSGAKVESKAAESFSDVLKQSKQLIKNRQVIYVNILAFLTYAAIPTFGAVWGVVYLHSLGYSQVVASGVVSLIWLGLAIGSPLVGLLSDIVDRRKIVLILCSVTGLVISWAILGSASDSRLVMGTLFFLLGFAGAAQTLTFVKLAEFIPKELYSVGAGFNNMTVMAGGLIIPQAVGFMVHMLSEHHAHTYTKHNLIIGLAILPLLYLVSIGIGCLLKGK